MFISWKGKKALAGWWVHSPQTHSHPLTQHACIAELVENTHTHTHSRMIPMTINRTSITCTSQVSTD
ncbi:uncharacterized protein BO95DRAFT_195637 [Aspergillus brunneoviolaceus CBS 621.78]|uniref:Uncharacterized protein n=1 Tax=Aspergillus brunneoviolaceus CBS 621.78 TaxID=1450534 RepID=A0ACD1GME6_9EURO|nr:hypothetical protein BO95DRAFT_195637 [Aspergillus brunneoviolaceus CBS 621.78]RAH50251.1 hypothetical protein BO95DRAFT_195637 [Aspergillus brunneoviolaceus CBS 621.78]